MIIAIDTGGTKTLVAGFDTTGAMQQLAKFPTPRNFDEYLELVSQSITESIDSADIDAISVALPGPIINGVLSGVKNLDQSWLGLDIVAKLSQTFKNTPILAANDADLAGISEARTFDAIPKLSLYVTLSTGVGAGLAFDGCLSPHLAHFEAGWMRLPFEGKLQLWEDFASGRSFYERYGQFGSDVSDPAKWQDFAQRASAGLGVLIPMFHPDRIVIGGSMGTHFAKYETYLREAVTEAVPDFDTLRITQAKHPEEAVIYGCYYHAVDQLANQST